MDIPEPVMSPPPIEVSPSTTPSPLKQEPGAKTPSYSQTRRPAGGTSRPLPSPGDIELDIDTSVISCVS